MDGQNRIELRQQLRKRSPIVKDWDQDHQFAGVCRTRAGVRNRGFRAIVLIGAAVPG